MQRPLLFVVVVVLLIMNFRDAGNCQCGFHADDEQSDG
jgi:hypothetical protein